MTRLRSAAALLVLAAALSSLPGCESPTESPVCTAIAVDALVVTVVDDASGQRLCDAQVTAVDGSFREELRGFGPSPDCTYSGPTERAGVYDVRATRAGYETGAITGVRVNRDVCHVIPVRLTLRIKKTG